MCHALSDSHADLTISIPPALLQQLELNAQAEALLRGLGLGDAAAKLKASNEEAEEALRKAKSQGANLKLVDAGLVQGESLLEQEMRLRASKTAGDGQGGSSSK